MPQRKAFPTTPPPPDPDRPFEVGRVYLVVRASGPPRPATVLNSRVGRLGKREAYISFTGEDKRLDAWVPSSALGDEVAAAGPSRLPALNGGDPGPSTSVNGRANSAPAPTSERSTPEREHAIVTRVRNFEDVRFGEYLVRTWYYSPYPMPIDTAGGVNGGAGAGSSTAAAASPALAPESKRGGRKRKEAPAADEKERQRLGPRTTSDVLSVGVGKGGEGARGRLWVCDLCFKYMRTRAGWDMHSSSCSMLQPPGRRVYQRGSYTIWEIDGAQATLYCQNLSLFGKLFIDHKSVFFHVENFLFYVICDAATSKRDQVMAFFSKEKFSYDDYNLACIVTFPPHQNRGFGKLLIEFSYYLTRHPSTRPASGSPGTPERPLSDLGLKGYMAYWVAVVLRVCRSLLAEGDSAPTPTVTPKKPASTEGRSLRVRKRASQAPDDKVVVNGVDLAKRPDPTHSGQYAIITTVATLARACHLRTDDVQLVLAELGFLRYRRHVPPEPKDHADGEDEIEADKVEEELGEWQDIEVVITRESVDEMWAKWRVREHGVLEEKYVLL